MLVTLSFEHYINKNEQPKEFGKTYSVDLSNQECYLPFFLHIGKLQPTIFNIERMKFLTYLTTAYTNRIVQTSEEAYQRIMRNFLYIEECMKWNESFIVQMKENARSICGLACLCHRYGTIIKNWTLHHTDDNEEIYSYQLDEQTIKRLANTFENMIQENAMLRIYNKETHTIQSVPETYYDDAIFELLGSQPIMMKNFNQMCIKHDIPTIWAKYRIDQHILKGTIKIIQNSELYAQRIIQKS